MYSSGAIGGFRVRSKHPEGNAADERDQQNRATIAILIAIFTVLFDDKKRDRRQCRKDEEKYDANNYADGVRRAERFDAKASKNAGLSIKTHRSSFFSSKARSISRKSSSVKRRIFRRQREFFVRPRAEIY